MTMNKKTDQSNTWDSVFGSFVKPKVSINIVHLCLEINLHNIRNVT